MSNVPSATSDLLLRFTTEQNYIKQYVDFLNLKTSVFEEEFEELFFLLGDFEVASINYKRDVSVWWRPYSPGELQNLKAMVKDILPKLQEKIKIEEEIFQRLEEPSNVMRTSANSPEGEMMEWITRFINRNPSQFELDSIKNLLRDHIRRIQDEYGDEQIDYKIDLIDYYIAGAVYIKKFQALETLKSLPSKLDELFLLTRIMTPHSEISIYRQGFINLMTVFDATIFDIARIAIKNDFFNLISVFGKQEKLALKELNNYSSFEDFRDGIIEEQLKAKYLKDLLFIFSSLGVDCVDSRSGVKFIQLIELTQRRNIHIHNRGLVDEKYLEKDEKGSPKYNIYKFALNDLAGISDEYFELANKLCLDCIRLTAQWADSI